MEIIRCDSKSDAAQKAFRLRYQVYGPELGVDDPDIDHMKRIFIDPLDRHSRIYVAIKDGEAIATVRALYDREYDFSGGLPETVRNMLGLEGFLQHHAGALAISTKFAISPNHRGSFAANLVTARMYRDFLDDGIDFVFSWCAPYLFDFYSQLGFHMYSRPVCDRNGLWTPIVLPIRDWRHLRNIKSPLLKLIDREMLDLPPHPSVTWFEERYGDSIGKYVGKCDDRVLEKIFSLSGSHDFGGDFRGDSVFSSINAEGIRKIVGSGKVLRFAPGQVVIQEGNITDEMFIVVEGEIRISIKDRDLLSFKIGPGEAFGEIAMLSRSARTADCIATQETEVAILSRQNLLRLIKIEPELSTQLLFNLATSLSLKLKRTNEYIASSKAHSYWSSLILEIRTSLNLSHEGLAELLDATPEDISIWENGFDVPCLEIQRMLERIACDRNITSLGGLVEMVRCSPSRMFIVDEDYFVIAASRSSEWIESVTVEEQLSGDAEQDFCCFSEKLKEVGFWKGRGGVMIEYEYNDNGELWRSVITSVSVRDRIYAIVQQTIV